jgi:hypothetical protein
MAIDKKLQGHDGAGISFPVTVTDYCKELTPAFQYHRLIVSS